MHFNDRRQKRMRAIYLQQESEKFQVELKEKQENTKKSIQQFFKILNNCTFDEFLNNVQIKWPGDIHLDNRNDVPYRYIGNLRLITNPESPKMAPFNFYNNSITTLGNPDGCYCIYPGTADIWDYHSHYDVETNRLTVYWYAGCFVKSILENPETTLQGFLNALAITFLVFSSPNNYDDSSETLFIFYELLSRVIENPTLSDQDLLFLTTLLVARPMSGYRLAACKKIISSKRFSAEIASEIFDAITTRIAYERANHPKPHISATTYSVEECSLLSKDFLFRDSRIKHMLHKHPIWKSETEKIFEVHPIWSPDTELPIIKGVPHWTPDRLENALRWATKDHPDENAEMLRKFWKDYRDGEEKFYYSGERDPSYLVDVRNYI